MRIALVALFAALLPATAAHAGRAGDTVAGFYADIMPETDPEIRLRFVDPALGKILASESGAGCIDRWLALDAADYDEAEIAKTLTLVEMGGRERAIVVAKFTVFEEPREIEWTMARVGDAWKVADIASITNGWRLSSLNCG